MERAPSLRNSEYRDVQEKICKNAMVVLALMKNDPKKAQIQVKNLVKTNRDVAFSVLTYEVDGWTPVHACALKGSKKLLKTMLQSGIAVNCVMGQPEGLPARCTLLHIAANRNDKKVVSFLLKEGADVHARDSHGRTPLYYAKQCGCKDSVRVLVECGANMKGCGDAISPDTDLPPSQLHHKSHKCLFSNSSHQNQPPVQGQQNSHQPSSNRDVFLKPDRTSQPHPRHHRHPPHHHGHRNKLQQQEQCLHKAPASQTSSSSKSDENDVISTRKKKPRERPRSVSPAKSPKHVRNPSTVSACSSIPHGKPSPPSPTASTAASSKVSTKVKSFAATVASIAATATAATLGATFRLRSNSTSSSAVYASSPCLYDGEGSAFDFRQSGKHKQLSRVLSRSSSTLIDDGTSKGHGLSHADVLRQSSTGFTPTVKVTDFDDSS